ncbi:MAG: hypothetical protein AVDCRST_MAG61-8, partial [uncultured Friedmanniella sp.]
GRVEIRRGGRGRPGDSWRGGHAPIVHSPGAAREHVLPLLGPRRRRTGGSSMVARDLRQGRARRAVRPAGAGRTGRPHPLPWLGCPRPHRPPVDPRDRPRGGHGSGRQAAGRAAGAPDGGGAAALELPRPGRPRPQGPGPVLGVRHPGRRRGRQHHRVLPAPRGRPPRRRGAAARPQPAARGRGVDVAPPQAAGPGVVPPGTGGTGAGAARLRGRRRRAGHHPGQQRLQHRHAGRPAERAGHLRARADRRRRGQGGGRGRRGRPAQRHRLQRL